ncbi:hypothetical protein FRB94_013736 [Tulasnella sp. JGI-2019a]|nr:hypothetical protein FRB94_013736 [Tulasnella sp. JGI-2019a]KAG9009179.1 hypothetical protein FRB93_005675 [Tulasnella sp. JGI-2019a]
MTTQPQEVFDQALEALVQDLTSAGPMASTNYTPRPVDEETHIHQIDHQISSLLLAHRRFCAQVSTRIVELRRLRTDMAKIHRLPLELLVTIFRHLSGIDKCIPPGTQRDLGLHEAPFDYTKRLLTAARVCKRWRVVILESSQLWTLVDIDKPKKSTLTALRLSRDNPISVIGAIHRADPVAWSIALQNLHRWERAHLRASPGHRTDDLETINPLILKDFHLHVYDEGHTMDLFSGHVPKLRDLHLRGVILQNWDSFAHDGLRSLSLSGVRVPSPQQMVSVLQASPNLEVLRISKLRSGAGAIDGSTAINLPRLRILEISEAISIGVLNLLKVLDAPHCVEYDFNLGAEEVPATVFTVITTHLSTPFRSHLPFSTRLSIVYEPMGFKILVTPVDPSRPEFVLSLCGGAVIDAIFKWAVDQIVQKRSSNSSIPVHITYTTLPNRMRSCYEPYHLLSGVETLAFEYCSEVMDVIIRELSTPWESGDGTRSWLWPKLQHLSVGYSKCSPNMLLTMVENRSVAGKQIQAGASNGVAPLLSFVARGRDVMNPAIFWFMKSVIGTSATWEAREDDDDDEFETDEDTNYGQEKIGVSGKQNGGGSPDDDAAADDGEKLPAVWWIG